MGYKEVSDEIEELSQTVAELPPEEAKKIVEDCEK